MRVLITGGGGFFGQYLNLKFGESDEVFTLYYSKPGNCLNYRSEQLDIINFERLEKIFLEFKPEIVIHLAALSNPGKCENLTEEDVNRINVDATKRIAELSYENDSLLIFTSTDLVYDGSKHTFHSEHSPLNPLSKYAKSKILAEEKIRSTFNNYVILRTALLYGISLNNNKNAFDEMFRNLRIGKDVNLFYNQYRTPLSTLDAARIIYYLAEKRISNITVNFGGWERVSRFELGEAACEVMGFNKSLLKRKSLEAEDILVKVPDVSLNTEKLQRLGIKQKGINSSLIELKEFVEKFKL